MSEEKKDIPKFRRVGELKGYEGFDEYYVFPNGDVYHVHKLASRSNRNGYKKVRMSHGRNDRRTVLPHVLVALGWLADEIPDTHQVNHKDYDRQNAHVDNLEVVTILENIAHRDARKDITKS